MPHPQWELTISVLKKVGRGQVLEGGGGGDLVCLLALLCDRAEAKPIEIK